MCAEKTISPLIASSWLYLFTSLIELSQVPRITLRVEGMSYLEEIKTQITNRDFSKLLQLWEEYCTSDSVDADEFAQILEAIRGSDFSIPFGKFAETGLLLWRLIQDPEESYRVLRLIIDIQTTNSSVLAETAFQALKERYGSDPHFDERLRLVGLRNREHFQGSLRNYDLLAHMKVGNYVYHSGGWGTGEIVEVSPVREQLAVEFESVSGRRHLTFANAFRTLTPLDSQHFYARRFADPDDLEEYARKDPVEVLKILLRDLGPRNAAELKDELCELVIPEKDWTKWWQWTRNKVKKDPMIETPGSLKEPFRVRQKEISPEERLHKALLNPSDTNEVIQRAYTLVRDMPHLLKHEHIKSSLQHKMIELLANEEVKQEQRLQIHLFLEAQFNYKPKGVSVEELIQEIEHPEQVINAIEVLALKKRALTAVRDHRNDWIPLFLNLLFSVQQSPLRDYIFKELVSNQESAPHLEKRLVELLNTPTLAPELFVWYFQKLISKSNEKVPFRGKEHICSFFESFLILYSALENQIEWRELIKKMYLILSGKRYAVVRAILEGTDLQFIQEFLLLISKCQTLSDHDIKILRSLAEVVHPSLAGQKKKRSGGFESNIIWTTEEGYRLTQERIRQIGTVEMVENAREVEAARALGDLRENSEYKFALEKRSHLQSELKRLSDQLNRARIITKDDLSNDEVGIGSHVEIENVTTQQRTAYTILGPWDAKTDANVLSFQSKLAQAMLGAKVGDTFRFRDDEYRILSLGTYQLS